VFAAVRDKGVDIIEKLACLRRGGIALVICLLLPVFTGCHYREDSGVTATEEKILFDRIAVVPFQQIAPEEPGGGAVSCPLCGVIFTANRSPGSPEMAVEKLFLEQVGKVRPKLTLLAGERVEGIYRRISANSLKAPLRQVLRDVGGELEVEGIVVGHVYRFRERKGVAYTVEQPASVTFDLHLLRVSDGAIVWRGQFDKTQSSLMENILQIASFFREKGRWVTAEELAEEGMEQVLQTFPGLP
jgi:hypothetical protein